MQRNNREKIKGRVRERKKEREREKKREREREKKERKRENLQISIMKIDCFILTITAYKQKLCRFCIYLSNNIFIYILLYTGCPRRIV